MVQKIVVTKRECRARRVPTGEPQIIPANQFVTITQDLGGSFTVTWRGNMLRIDGVDADVLGREALTAPVFDESNEGTDISEKNVWLALESVFDPEIPINLVELGLIYDVAIEQTTGIVTIQMTLTAPGCGMGPVLVSDVEDRVGTVPNVKKVVVELVFDPPWSRDMMSEEAQLEAGLFF